MIERLRLTKRQRELLEGAKRGRARPCFAKAFEALMAAHPEDPDPDIATFVLARKSFSQPFASLYAATLATFGYRDARGLSTSLVVMEREVREHEAFLLRLEDCEKGAA